MGRPQTGYYAQKPDTRPRVPEDVLRMETIQIERKSFNVALKENARGRFLRITEGASGRLNTLIVPATGLKEFLKLIAEMVQANEQLPPAGKSSPPPQG